VIKILELGFGADFDIFWEGSVRDKTRFDGATQGLSRSIVIGRQMSGTTSKEMRGLKIGLTDDVPRQGKHLAEPMIERLCDISCQFQVLLLIFSYRDGRRPEKYKPYKVRKHQGKTSLMSLRRTYL
jgi:hypothetical protein